MKRRILAEKDSENVEPMKYNNYNINGYKSANQRKPRRKTSPMLKFISIVFTTVFIFIFISGMVVLGYIVNMPMAHNSGSKPVADGGAQRISPIAEDSGVDVKEVDKTKVKTNFAVFGVDMDGTRTDTIFVGCFDRAQMSINILSIPRDLKVAMPSDRVKILRNEGYYVPDGGVMKMNEVHSYAREYNLEFAVLQLEEYLGVDIDYTVRMDTDGFRDIVDAVGGVEMTLDRSYYYYDPDQDLLIDLKPGTQVLYGDKAEQFVRFRRYLEGDVERVRTQQRFMQEMAKQVLDKDTLLSSAGDLLVTLLNCVTTDITLGEAMQYLKYLPDLKAENIQMFMLPGEGAYIGDVSYFLPYEEEVLGIVEEVFLGTAPEDIPQDSKLLRIQVLNGAGVSGMATSAKDWLAGQGYRVLGVADYGGTQQNHTRIYVKKSGYGKDLQDLFTGSEIIVDKSKVEEGYDITIVLGRNETAHVHEEG